MNENAAELVASKLPDESPQSVRQSTRTPLWAIAAVLLVPLIQVASQPSWSFSQPGWDQWFYHGYFIHLRHHLTQFAGTYYGTRLAWILPGFLANLIFAPLAANAALRLYVYWIAALSSYFFVRRSHGWRCALITTLLLCSYPTFLAAVGWDGVDGPAIAYALLCIEELAAAAGAIGTRRYWRAAFGGAAFAAAVHCNLFLLALGPVIALVWLVRIRARQVRLAASAIGGFVGLTGALGAVNLAMGGSFLFFLPSLTMAKSLATSPNPWYEKASVWINSAWGLVVPSAVLVMTLAFLLRRAIGHARQAWNRDALIPAVDAGSLGFLYAILFVLQLRGIPVLQAFYYADYLTVFLVVAVAALIGAQLDPVPDSFFTVITAGCVLLALFVGTEVPRFLPSFVATSYLQLRAWPHLTAVALTLVIALGILAATLIRSRAVRGAVIGLLAAATLLHIGPMTLREDVGANISKQAFLYTDLTSRRLGELTHDGNLWVWYSYSPGNEYYTSVASTYMWGLSLLNSTMPDTAKLRTDHLQRGDYIALLSDRQTVHSQAVAALAGLGILVKPVTQLVSNIGDRRLLISLLQLTNREFPDEVRTFSPDLEALRPGPVLMDYDADALEKRVDRLLYQPTLVKTPGWVIVSRDSRDHAATPYTPVPAGVAAIRLIVSDNRGLEPYGPLNFVVQQQGYDVLYRSGTLLGDRSRGIALKPGAREIRIALLPNEYGYIRFPEHIKIEGFGNK